VAAVSKAEAITKAQAKLGSKAVVLDQEEDVLDTWFSSALVPFANFGWPEQVNLRPV